MLNPFKRSEGNEGNEHIEALARALHNNAEILRLLTSSQKITDSLENAHYRLLALKAIAKAHVEAGDMQQVIEKAGFIKNFNLRSQTLLAIVQALAEAGNLELALKTATGPGFDYSPQALIEIAKVQAKAGEIQQALDIVRILGPGYRLEILTAIAQTQAESGFIAQSMETARLIDPSHRLQAFVAIVKAQARAGDIEQALSAIDAIESDAYRFQALEAIACTQAEAGDFESAMETAESIKNLDFRTQVLTSIANIQVKANALEKLLKKASSIENAGYRSRIYMAIAQAQAEVGDIEHAIKTADSIGSIEDRSKAIMAIAQAQARTGDIEQALKTADSIEYSDYRAQSLCLIAQTQAMAGNFKQAMKMANAIENLGYRTQTLSSIACAQAKASQQLLSDGKHRVSDADKLVLFKHARSISDAGIIQDLGAVSTPSGLDDLSSIMEPAPDEIDLLESGFISAHILTPEQKQKYYGRFANRLEEVSSDSDSGYAINRLVNDILVSLNYNEHGETKKVLKDQADRLSPDSKQLHRLIKSLAELPDDNAKLAALQLASQKLIPDKIFKYIIRKLVDLKYIPGIVLDIGYIDTQEDLNTFKALIRDFPSQAINTIQVFADNPELSMYFSMSREYPTLSSAIKDFGSITPNLYLKYKQAKPDERSGLVEKIKILKPKFFKNQNIEDILDPDDNDILAELVHLAYKPVGMTFADVSELLPQLEDHTHDLDKYEFPEDGYAFDLGKRVRHELKDGEQIDPKITQRIKTVFSGTYPTKNPNEAVTKDRLPKNIEDIRNVLSSLAQASTTISDEDLSKLLSLMSNQPLVQDFKAKKPDASDSESIFDYLENSRELLGVYFNDNYIACLEEFLDNNPEVFKSLQSTLSDKRIAILRQRIKGMKGKEGKASYVARPTSYVESAHDIAQLLTDYLSVSVIKKLTSSIKKEQGKYKTVQKEEVEDNGQDDATTRAYISKNKASFFAKASAGLCTANDIPLFERPDHFHINTVENKVFVRANIQAYLIEYPKGKKSLLLRGFNPNIKYLEGLNIGAFCDEVIAIAKQFQTDNNLDGVYITEPLVGYHALSNRQSVQDHLIKKFCKPENEVMFDFNITNGIAIGKMYRV